MTHWVITGVSSGFGQALAKAALAKGYSVTGTVRQDSAKLEFDSLAPGRSWGALLDVTDAAAVPRAIDDMEAKRPIDVLVNNAGYGFEGAVEEASLEQIAISLRSTCSVPCR